MCEWTIGIIVKCVMCGWRADRLKMVGGQDLTTTWSNPTNSKVVTEYARRSAIAVCTARRVCNVKRASFLLGVGAFRLKFYWNGVIPCQNVDAV